MTLANKSEVFARYRPHQFPPAPLQLEFNKLTFRIAQHPISDFALSVISFHEQVIGAHSFINRAQNNTDIARGYALLLETLNSFAKAPVLPFDSKAIAIFDEMRTQKVRVATMD